MLRKLIEFIHVDIDEELRGEIAEWQPFVYDAVMCGRISECHIRLEAADDLHDKRDDTLVKDVPRKNVEERLVVDRGKELPYVAFEHPNRARVITRYLIGKGAKAIYSHHTKKPHK